MSRVTKTALFRFLWKRNPSLHARLADLRELITKWLAYVPATFPHYTAHTVEHSDEILRQTSRFLFKNPEQVDESPEPVVADLTSVEAFIVGAAAYVHDAGMVCSDDEKSRILQSADWRDWLKRGNNNARFQEVTSNPPKHAGELFAASLQLRFLIAEFVRQHHHERAAIVLRQYLPFKDAFAQGSELLVDAVEKVCVAHGLASSELYDPRRFPDRIEILGETVSLRFCAVVLRLGDLLDLSTDRACPLLLNAASPLPADSYAHWTKHRNIRKFVDWQSIEIDAFCHEAEEHRLLHSWCKWIVDETERGRSLLRKSKRHSDWAMPLATIDFPEATIKIMPADDANYVYRDWRFELDQQAVFDRLIRSVYSGQAAFVRELIQNAADATRARVALEVRKLGASIPKNGWDWPLEQRLRFPIRVKFAVTNRLNDNSGAAEPYYVLEIEDNGIGMTEEIIRDYFLQVGRSYFGRSDFRKEYGFSPAGRFGLGFLSVFAESDDVRVETKHVDSPADDPSLVMKLIGPQSYFLVSHGTRVAPGTSISIGLRSSLAHLGHMIETAFADLELPIEYIVDEKTTRIDPTPVSSGIIAERDLADLGHHRIRSFVISTPDARGRILISELVGRDENCADWTSQEAIERESVWNPQLHPLIVPAGRLSMNGVRVGDFPLRAARTQGTSQFAIQLDYRGDLLSYGLSRESVSGYEGIVEEVGMRGVLTQIVQDHVASRDLAGRERTIYLNRLAKAFPFMWLLSKLPAIIPCFVDGRDVHLSLDEFTSFGEIVIVAAVARGSKNVQDRAPVEAKAAHNVMGLVMLESSLWSMDDLYRKLAFARPLRLVNAVYDKGCAVAKFRFEEAHPLPVPALRNFVFGNLGPSIAAGYVGANTGKDHLVNLDHPFVRWFANFSEQRDFPKALSAAANSLRDLVPEALQYYSITKDRLKQSLAGWNRIAPAHLRYTTPLDDSDFSHFLLIDPRFVAGLKDDARMHRRPSRDKARTVSKSNPESNKSK